MPNDAPPTDHSTTGENRQPIDRCPVCRYSLQGLPSAHHCPECGFEYDEHTRVWRPKRIRALRGLWLPIFLIADVALLLFFGVLSPMLKLFMVFGGAFIVAVSVILWYSNWRSLPFAAVTPRGIVYRWFFRARITAWPLVDRGGKFDERCCYVRNGIWVIDYGPILPDKDSREQFRQAVADGIARYNDAPNSESQAPAAADTIESSTTSTERSQTDAG